MGGIPLSKTPRTVVACLVLVLLALLTAAAVRVGLPGLTRLELADAEGGRVLLRDVLRDGEPVTLTWHNSLFDQPVREVFYARGGRLVEDEVTFIDPEGAYEMPVSAADIGDLFQTGGAFSARGLNRPFEQIIFRVGEIGDLHVQVRGQTVALKQEVGFGGRVQLSTHRPTAFEAIASFSPRS